MFRDYQNYEIFADGRIWSKVRKKFLKPQTTRKGYQQVGLTDNEGKRHQQLVHRVCWIAVNGREVPEGYELNHLDEDKMNNHITNLQLCSHKDNVNYGTRTERMAATLKGKFINNLERSKRVGAFKNGELIMVFPSTKEAGRNGYNQGAVAACCRDKFKREGNNKYKGYVWKFLDDDN